MARKPSAKVVLARSGLTTLGLAIADGLLEVGRTIVEVADPPDSPLPPYPLGQGLPLQGGVIVYVDGKKVAGWSQRGTQPVKPRAAETPKGAVVAIVGYGFPGRFNEAGTLNSPAQPFLSPALDQTAPHIGEIVAGVTGPQLGRKP